MCYRTPATIMDAADRVVTALGHPPVYPVRSVRDLPGCLEVTDLSASAPPALTQETWAQALTAAVRQEVARLDRQVGAGGGRVAVICPAPGDVATALGEDPALVAQMEAPDGDVLRARLAVMGPVASKGLEFDVVVLVDPAVIGQTSPGDLYVAMTRPTRRLRVVSREELPAGLA